MQKPMLAGFPSSVSTMAARPTAAPAERTMTVSFFINFSTPCYTACTTGWQNRTYRFSIIDDANLRKAPDRTVQPQYMRYSFERQTHNPEDNAVIIDKIDNKRGSRSGCPETAEKTGNAVRRKGSSAAPRAAGLFRLPYRISRSPSAASSSSSAFSRNRKYSSPRSRRSPVSIRSR